LSDMAPQPLIGIPSGSYPSSFPGVRTYRFNGNYSAALAAAGGLPVAIPLNLPEPTLAALLGRLDGLCLAGGDDVDPVRYGEARHPALGAVDAERDRTELWLSRRALDERLPLLAICRGIQVLNVAAGGTLYQDLAADLPESLPHSYRPSPSTPWDRPKHRVRLAAGSGLARLLSAEELQTNSFHHQAVKQVAGGFTPVAWADDGVIEAIEANGQHFAIGVQWHPEAMARRDPAAQQLFRAFIAAAGEYHAASRAGGHL